MNTNDPVPSKPSSGKKTSPIRTTANLVGESSERVANARKSAESEFQKVQKQFGDRESQINERTEKQFEKFRDDLRSYPGVEQAEADGEQLKWKIAEQFVWLNKQFDSSLETLLGGLPIASRGEIEKLDRKLNHITRPLSAFDKAVQEKANQPETKSPPPATEISPGISQNAHTRTLCQNPVYMSPSCQHSCQSLVIYSNPMLLWERPFVPLVVRGANG